MIANHDNIDWMCPINWSDPLNRGLEAHWLAIQNQPGWKSSQIFDLTDPLYGNVGTLNGSTWVAGGRPGGYGALSFDGLNDYVILDAIKVDAFLPESTLTLWYRGTDPGDWKTLIKFVNTGSNTTYGIDLNRSYATFAYSAGQVLPFIRDDAANVLAQHTIDASGIFDGSFHWLAFVIKCSTNTVRVFADGSELAMSSGGPQQTPASFGAIEYSPAIAAGNNRGVIERHVDCELDDIRIYSRATSPTEIRGLYLESLLGYPSLLNRADRRYGFAPAAAATRRNNLTLLGVS